MFSKKVTKIGRNLTVFFEVLVQVILLKLVSKSHQILEKKPTLHNLMIVCTDY